MKTLEAMEKVILGKTLRPNSIKNYQKVFARLAKHTEDFPSAPGYLNEYFSAISKLLAPQTVRLHYRIIKSAATYLEGNYGTINPFKKLNTDIIMIKMPHADKVPRRYYNAEQLGLIIRACKTERDLALVSSLIDSGCRVEDLASLKASDIDDTGFNTHKGKTGGHHYRLDPHIRSMLKQLAGSEENYVFQLCRLGPNSKYEYVPGMPTTANALSYRIRRICINAGFTGAKLGAHTLRHSVGNIVAKETKSPLAVKGILQHENISTSMLYIHDAETDLAQEFSPLKLVRDKFSEMYPNPITQQRPLLDDPNKPINTSGKTEIIIDDVPQSSMYELIEQSLVQIPDSHKSVRPLLNAQNLQLIRRMVIAVSFNGASTDAIEAKKLYNRMLQRKH